MSSSLFADLGLGAPILGALDDLGYEQPSPIQEQSIPLLLAGKNLLGVAQTGTGKTAAFALPLLNNLDPTQQSPQVLILTPTRELAIQVAEACQSYARKLKNFHVLPIYGGQEMSGQLRALRRGVQVVVGTPGRVMDHLRRESLNLAEIRAVVLDEADEMLRMGFIDDVETILAKTPDSAQRALFSATMPAAIQRIAAAYLGDAEEVRIEAKTRTVERISQRYLLLGNHQKLDALTRILEVETFDGMIIFVRTKSATVELAEKLEARGFAASALNGDLSQQLRERTVGRLKNGQLDIVVATDVAARGLDVERISHVVNYDIPYDNESYVHRIGRTGRAGREGNAILFVTPKERRLLQSIERSTRQPITEMQLPSGQQVSAQRIQQFRGQLLETLEKGNLDKFKNLVASIANEQEIDPLDIAAALVYQQQQERPLYPEFRDPPPPAREKPGRDRDKPRDRDRDAPRGKRPPRRADGDMPPLEKYRIEVGHDHGVQPKDVVGAIANEADIDSQYIGRIEIYETFTTVDLPEGMPRETLAHLRKMRIRNHPALMSRVEPGQEPPPKTRAREGKVFEGKGGKFKGDKFKGAKPAGGAPGEGKFRKDKPGKKTYRAKD
ncbi:MAG TPA: DEAD/DEAH box helicase [Porticoccaceae bacterium]|nr:DEAD/DEAH box helicase [Porticoccaceae bacterium]